MAEQVAKDFCGCSVTGDGGGNERVAIAERLKLGVAGKKSRAGVVDGTNVVLPSSSSRQGVTAATEVRGTMWTSTSANTRSEDWG